MGLFAEILWIFGSILGGLWLADFATGCFHWAVDSYANPEWPIIGPHYIEPSHLHHEEDMYTFELSSLVTHLYIWTAVIIVGTLFWALGLMTLMTASACGFGFLTNVIHRWSHTQAQDNVLPVRVLQRIGLFQSTPHHTFHHSGASDSHYCLLTDHINPLLEAMGLWKGLDRIMMHIGIEKYWWETKPA